MDYDFERLIESRSELLKKPETFIDINPDEFSDNPLLLMKKYFFYFDAFHYAVNQAYGGDGIVPDVKLDQWVSYWRKNQDAAAESLSNIRLVLEKLIEKA